MTSLPRRDPTLDVLRGLTIAAVTAFHLHADVRGVDAGEAPARGFVAALAAADLRAMLGELAHTLVAAPAFRPDLFLFVTGVVLMRAPPRAFGQFLRRRARAVLPNYWLGSLLFAVLLVALAALRAALAHTSFAEEVHHGTRLARGPFRFEAHDVVRSLSVLGRFQDVRTFQVVAPSMWYVMLLLQIYVLFPALRRLYHALGASRFLAAVLAFTWAARAWTFHADPLPSFGPNPTVLYWIPFRLAPVALGMVTAATLPRLWLPARAVAAYALAAIAGLWVAMAFWLAAAANRPGTLAGVIGPVLPLALALPATWWIADAVRRTPAIGPLTSWAGHHSLSILVMQDLLRLGTGTWQALVGDLGRWFWPLLPAYLALVVALARLWDPLVLRIRDRWWRAPRALSASA